MNISEFNHVQCCVNNGKVKTLLCIAYLVNFKVIWNMQINRNSTYPPTYVNKINATGKIEKVCWEAGKLFLVIILQINILKYLQ